MSIVKEKDKEMKEISLKKSKKVAKIQTNGFSIDELIKELIKEKERIKNKDKIIYQGPIKLVREEDKKIIFDLKKGSFYLNLIDSKYYHQNNKPIDNFDFVFNTCRQHLRVLECEMERPAIPSLEDRF